MHRIIGSRYKHSITAENSTDGDSSYIKEGFRLKMRFEEMGSGGIWKREKMRCMEMGRDIVPRTEQVRKNVKVQEGVGIWKHRRWTLLMSITTELFSWLPEYINVSEICFTIVNYDVDPLLN